MAEFAIAFKGTFRVAEKGLYSFNFQAPKALAAAQIGPLETGGPVERKGFRRNFDPGTYPFEFVYQRKAVGPQSLLFFVEFGGRPLTLSVDAHEQLKVPGRIISTERVPRVVRTTMAGIPPESMAVGLAGGGSFVMGRNASIYTAWERPFLNIGPAVTGQGKNPSLTGPPWFAHNEGIHLQQQGERLPLKLAHSANRSS